MANKDFINILQEIRGTGAPGTPFTNGIWYELTMADTNGNPGIYGDILATYGVFRDNADAITTVSDNLLDIQTANSNIASIDTVSDNINNVNILAEALGTATISGGGQFLGTTVIKGIQYMSQTLAEPIIIPSGLNAFSIDNLEILSGGSITVSNGAVYKVL